MGSAPIESSSLAHELAEARERYRSARPVGAALDEQAREVMPGGNTRSVLYHPPFPLRIARAYGSVIVDVDGFEYVDLLGEYTAGLYGHNDPVILDAVREALNDGLGFGAHNTRELVLARLLVDRFPALELVRFTNSGTEANLMAVSLARAVTGRPAIAVIDGGYHGGLLTFGGGVGSPVNAPYDTVLLTYNDIESSRAALRAAGARIAAVVVESTLGSGGCIPGDPEYLRMLQDEARAAGSLFILDEVMTSRLGPHGSAPGLGLEPDLITLGKYLGGGLTFGAFGGRADVMAAFDPSKPGALPHAGTFNNNVLTMAAGIAGLTQLLTDDALNELNARGDRLRMTLRSLMAPYGWTASGSGSMVGFHPVTGPITQPADLADADPRRRELLFLDVLERGWRPALRGFIALSLAVTDDEIDRFIDDVTTVLAARSSL